MSSLDKQHKPDASHIHVKLRLLFGLSPVQYMGTLLALFILAGLFLLLLYPGLKYYGSRVIIESIPAHVPVYVDEKLVGSTPLKVFVPQGQHTLTLKKNYFETYNQPIQIEGRRFLSLFWPKKVKYDINLTLLSLSDWLRHVYKEASLWHHLSENRIYHRPPLLTNTAKDLVALYSTLDDKNHTLVQQWAYDLRALVQDQRSLEHVSKALGILSTLPNMPKIELPTTWNDAVTQLPTESVPNLPGSMYVTNRPSQKLAGLTFMPANGRSVILDGATVEIDDFYYMPILLTWTDYTRLAGGNAGDETNFAHIPYNEEKLQSLIAQLGIELSKTPWGADYTVGVPSEGEWQLLQEDGLIRPTSFEWTRDPYIVHRSLFYAHQATLPLYFDTAMRTVRGQSVFSGTLPTDFRMGYEQDMSSPTIGIRLVLAKKSVFAVKDMIDG